MPSGAWRPFELWYRSSRRRLIHSINRHSINALHIKINQPKKNNKMKKITRYTSLFLALSILLASCSSTTLIQSTPTQAKVYLNSELVGETPYRHTDSKIVGSSMVVKLEKEGYKPFVTTITKDEQVDVGAIIGGLFVLVPFLWTMKYQPTHSYELQLLTGENDIKPEVQPIQNSKSKVDKLRELKQLLDEKIITADEFEKEKTKVLDMKE
jgi:hypothetical protein